MAYTQTNEVTNTVEIEMADGGKIVVELDENPHLSRSRIFKNSCRNTFTTDLFSTESYPDL